MYHNKKFLLELTKNFPGNIDLDRLIHVTYNIENAEVKLYHSSDNLNYLVKSTKNDQVNQYYPSRDNNILEKYKKKAVDFLGYEPDFSQVVIDVVMDDVIYFYTEKSTQKEFEKFYKVILNRFNIKDEEFFEVLSYLNNRKITNFIEAYKFKSIPVAKVPLKTGYFKVYVRPFNNGNSFLFNDQTKNFLEELLSCKPLKEERLINLITIYEFHTGRTQICTEDKLLKAKLAGVLSGHTKFKFERKKEKQDLPWSDSKEFYDLHSKKILSNKSFYHISMIGNTKEEFLAYIIKKAKIFKGAKILDMGCGSGYLVNSLTSYCDILGISNSIECVNQAKKNFPNANFELGNMENFKSKELLTHCLSLESSGYTDIRKTLSNAYSNLKIGGVFYLKDLFLKKNESLEEKENRVYWENYWKFKLNPIHRILDIAQEVGFKIVEFNLLTKKINPLFSEEILKLNLVEYKPPNPYVNFIECAEFLLVKAVKSK